MCTFFQGPNSFPNANVFRPRSYDFRRQNHAWFLTALCVHKNFFQTHNTSFTHKIMASPGRKKIVFCLTVVFIDKLHRTRQVYDKLKMSNICLATTMLPSAKERLVLPTFFILFCTSYTFYSQQCNTHY